VENTRYEGVRVDHMIFVALKVVAPPVSIKDCVGCAPCNKL
jgi:hypothetical protein